MHALTMIQFIWCRLNFFPLATKTSETDVILCVWDGILITVKQRTIKLIAAINKWSEKNGYG